MLITVVLDEVNIDPDKVSKISILNIY